MGCILSTKRPSSTLKTIRVVHLNGYVEDFEYPLTAGEVTGKPPTHFVCTRAQLASGGPKPLKPGTELEPGHVYFLLPYSTLQSGASPFDLASVARRLTKIAKTNQAQLAKSPSRNSGSSPVQGSPARSPDRFSAQPIRVEPENCVVGAYGLQRSSKARSWKPILETVRERSFNRKSESDLQEIPKI